MRIYFAIYIIINIALFSCGDKDRRSLEGTWFYMTEEDSAYNEIYFTKEFVFYNLSALGVTGIYDYRLSNDSILLGEEGKFFLEILDWADDKIQGYDQFGNILVLERFEMPHNDYKMFCTPDEQRVQLLRGRLFRGSKILLERGFAKPDTISEESILYIPESER